MPFPLGGEARSASVFLVSGQTYMKALRVPALPTVQWNPREVGGWPLNASSVEVIRPTVLFTKTAVTGGGSAPSPTVGQIWPRRG